MKTRLSSILKRINAEKKEFFPFSIKFTTVDSPLDKNDIYNLLMNKCKDIFDKDSLSITSDDYTESEDEWAHEISDWTIYLELKEGMDDKLVDILSDKFYFVEEFEYDWV